MYVTVCDVPRESYAVTDVEKLPFAAVAVELRLRLTLDAVVAIGAVSVPVGTVMLPVGPLVVSIPPAEVHPCTACPVDVSRVPLEFTWKLPPRVYSVAPCVAWT